MLLFTAFHLILNMDNSQKFMLLVRTVDIYSYSSCPKRTSQLSFEQAVLHILSFLSFVCSEMF
jgi:hypothetical protein